MKIPRSKLFASALVGVLFSCVTVTKHTPGFFPVTDPQISVSVQEKINSVYRVLVFSKKPLLFPSKIFEAVVSRISGTGYSKDLIADELKACGAQKKEKCEVTYHASATAFLVGSDKTLWTARHTFDGLIPKSAAVDDKLSLSDLGADLLILDSKNNVLIDTRKEPGSLKLSFLGRVPQGGGGPGMPSDIMADFAQFEVTRPLGQPLELETNLIPPKGEMVYVLGYPLKTTLRENYGAPNADGYRPFFSKGSVMSMAESHRNAKWPLPSKEEEKNLFNAYFYYAGDGVPGQSGGPVLNKDGKVVGMFVSHFAALKMKSPLEGYGDGGGVALRSQWMLKLSAQR